MKYTLSRTHWVQGHYKSVLVLYRYATVNSGEQERRADVGSERPCEGGSEAIWMDGLKVHESRGCLYWDLKVHSQKGVAAESPKWVAVECLERTWNGIFCGVQWHEKIYCGTLFLFSRRTHLNIC